MSRMKLISFSSHPPWQVNAPDWRITTGLPHKGGEHSKTQLTPFPTPPTPPHPPHPTPARKSSVAKRSLWTNCFPEKENMLLEDIETNRSSCWKILRPSGRNKFARENIGLFVSVILFGRVILKPTHKKLCPEEAGDQKNRGLTRVPWH
jgi:hypothetical protein